MLIKIWILILEIVIAFIIIFFLFYKFYFLRNPEREIPNNENLLVSPANWKIISIIQQNNLDTNHKELYKAHKKVIDDWTEWFTWATLISIMMTPMNVHYQKAPTKSTLISQKYQKWHFYNATKKKKNMRSTFQNEYNSMLFRTDEWYNFRVIQIAWALARRIVPELEINEIVSQWQRIWLIKLWSQVSVILDDNFKIIAKIWDIVIDWETIIAKKK